MKAERVFCERRMLSQKILVSFADLPKMQTLTPLKSHKTTVFCDSIGYRIAIYSDRILSSFPAMAAGDILTFTGPHRQKWRCRQ
jgi:hypothetical protein